MTVECVSRKNQSKCGEWEGGKKVYKAIIYLIKETPCPKNFAITTQTSESRHSSHIRTGIKFNTKGVSFDVIYLQNFPTNQLT